MKRSLILLCLVLAFLSCAKPRPGILAPGTVDGDVYTIKTPAGGTLVAWTAAEGAPVSKGALLGEVDPSKVRNSLDGLEISGNEISNQEGQLRKQIEDARANAAYLRKQVDRLTRLRQDKAVAGDELDKAQLKLTDAETRLYDLERSLHGLTLQRDQLANKRRALDLTLKDLRIVSPVNGTVLETFVSQGEMLLPGTPLADVLDLDSLYVETFLEEQEVAGLRLGDKAEVRVEGLPGRTFEGSVFYFGRKAEFSPKYILTEKERAALLYEVKVGLSGDRSVFKVGMPVTVAFAPKSR
jgi:HlyD family secretion protein